MPYIGQQPTNVAFLTDQFSGNGSTTAFTLSAAPANTSSILVAISGVLQDPSTYSVSGTTLTFSPAPPSGTGNISVRFLGIPASGVTTTAYRTVTEFTATAGQTTFSVPSYTVGFIDVYRNGVMLGSADYTATSGVSVVLVNGCTVGDLVEVISFQVSSVLNAIPASPSSVGTSYLVDGSVTTTKIANANVTMAKLDTQAQYTGFKNRLINGDMVIDQRNAGASVSVTGVGQYSVDRFRADIFSSATGRFSIQQSTVAPAGFVNSLLVTVTTANASPTTDFGYSVQQIIEGFNIADFGWGTANAQPVTLSFWVRSSITGTYPVIIQNSDADRAFGGQYTISAANTWEYKTITVSGITSGTWLTNNGIGARVIFGFGGGSNRTISAGFQSVGSFQTQTNVTGSTNLLATNGATWQVTGCQLEKGSTATSFDVLPYTTELALCQRYFQKTYNQNIVPGSTNATNPGAVWTSNPVTNSYPNIGTWNFAVPMRTTPTVTAYNPFSGVSPGFQGDGTAYTQLNTHGLGERSVSFAGNNVSVGTTVYMSLQAVASAEL